MALYGYKISGFAGNERYEEAAAYLDRRLKGFERKNEEFDADGSRTLHYERLTPEGTVQEVTLVKNVTESAVMVFSDIPMKSLKHGGILLTLRDIIPMTVFGALYYLLFWINSIVSISQKTANALNNILHKTTFQGLPYVNTAPILYRVLPQLYSTTGGMVCVIVLKAVYVLILVFATTKLLHYHRSMTRVRIIQFGGIFSAVYLIDALSYMFKWYSVSMFTSVIIAHPVTPVLLAFLIFMGMNVARKW